MTKLEIVNKLEMILDVECGGDYKEMIKSLHQPGYIHQLMNLDIPADILCYLANKFRKHV
jgi:hypothetical protein